MCSAWRCKSVKSPSADRMRSTLTASSWMSVKLNQDTKSSTLKSVLPTAIHAEKVVSPPKRDSGIEET